MPGIHQDHREATFDDVVDRFPEYAGRFHGHVGDPLGLQPVRHRQDLPGHGAPPASLLLHVVALQDSNRSFHRLLVDVQTGSASKNCFHERLLSSLRWGTSKGNHSALRALAEARPQFRFRGNVQTRLISGLESAKDSRPSPRAGAPKIPHSSLFSCFLAAARRHEDLLLSTLPFPIALPSN